MFPLQHIRKSVFVCVSWCVCVCVWNRYATLASVTEWSRSKEFSRGAHSRVALWTQGYGKVTSTYEVLKKTNKNNHIMPTKKDWVFRDHKSWIESFLCSCRCWLWPLEGRPYSPLRPFEENEKKKGWKKRCLFQEQIARSLLPLWNVQTAALKTFATVWAKQWPLY